MHRSTVFLVVLTVLFCLINAQQQTDSIFNDEIVYYDECRITVSPRNHQKSIRAYVQIQQPCNGTLLWMYPNLTLTLTIINLENDSFNLCFEQKSIQNNLIRSIQAFNTKDNKTMAMREINGNNGLLLCTPGVDNRVTTIIEAQPLYAGVYLRYAMYNKRHPWTTGPFPGWERSEKYLYGPSDPVVPTKRVRGPRKNFKARKMIH